MLTKWALKTTQQPNKEICTKSQFINEFPILKFYAKALLLLQVKWNYFT